MAGAPGLEPGKRASKARVLPLHYAPAKDIKLIATYYFINTADQEWLGPVKKTSAPYRFLNFS